MLSEERQSRIVNIVRAQGSITIQELMEQLNASESTIRRDLFELDSKGYLQKVYGGAVSAKVSLSNNEESVNTKREFNHDEKLKVAKYAASLINDDDFVYLDAGTTTELMIDFIKSEHAVFVTNGFEHARKLCERGFVTYIIGGKLKKSTEAIVGEEAALSLQKFNFTKGFWGTNGVSPEKGFSTPEVSEALVKQISMEQTLTKYVVCDSSKLNQISCVTFSKFKDATLITNSLNSEVSEYRNFENVVEVE